MLRHPANDELAESRVTVSPPDNQAGADLAGDPSSCAVAAAIRFLRHAWSGQTP